MVGKRVKNVEKETSYHALKWNPSARGGGGWWGNPKKLGEE